MQKISTQSSDRYAYAIALILTVIARNSFKERTFLTMLVTDSKLKCKILRTVYMTVEGQETYEDSEITCKMSE